MLEEEESGTCGLEGCAVLRGMSILVLGVNMSGISSGEMCVKGVCVGKYMAEEKSVEGDGIEEDTGH